MQRRILGLLILAVLMAAVPRPASPVAAQVESAPELPPSAALDLAALRAAYPGAISGLERNPAGQLELVLSGGQRLPYDDGAARTPRQALENPDIRTMLAQIYPLGPVTEASAHPAPDFDPGRARAQGFFEALYGHSEAEVRKGCETVHFSGHGVAFNARFGAAAALARVWGRISAQLPQHPGWRATLQPLGGALAWRHIAGTTRPSMHSFGLAIDVNPHLPYWRTETHPETVPARRKAFPPEILAAFEAEGFIWGGKWASFDLMHFEYRPELLLKARLLAGQGQ